MSVELNHTIIRCPDREASAHFLADILGLEVGPPTGRFLPIQTSNGVTLDFATVSEPVTRQHYAFLISEQEFDEAFARLEKTGDTYWADPQHSHPGEINHRDGGRGVYFHDPAGHSMEMLTRPYGSG